MPEHPRYRRAGGGIAPVRRAVPDVRPLNNAFDSPAPPALAAVVVGLLDDDGGALAHHIGGALAHHMGVMPVPLELHRLAQRRYG